MTTGGQFLIPGAIVVGFAMLGVAVYLGLTHREAPPPTSSLAASTTAASTLPIATATGVPVNVVEAQARSGPRRGAGGLLEAAVQPEVAPGRVAVGGHLGGGAQLVAEQGGVASGGRHGDDAIGY